MPLFRGPRFRVSKPFFSFFCRPLLLLFPGGGGASPTKTDIPPKKSRGPKGRRCSRRLHDSATRPRAWEFSGRLPGAGFGIRVLSRGFGALETYRGWPNPNPKSVHGSTGVPFLRPPFLGAVVFQGKPRRNQPFCLLLREPYCGLLRTPFRT